MRRHREHLEAICILAPQLARLDTDVVFAGGAVVGLLLTDSAAPDVRPTNDVDVIVGTVSYSAYTALQESLRRLGFKNDLNGPNCRFMFEGLVVDVMPAEGTILGFTNDWYEYALESAVEYELPDGTVIRLISAPAFVATKLDAFYDRGNGDMVGSHDLEDILAVVDGRPELVLEVKESRNDLRMYIASSIGDLLKDEDFIDAIPMHLHPDPGSQARISVIQKRLQDLVDVSLS